MTQQRIKPFFARFDPAHVFDGLFVPTKGRKRGRLFVPPRRYGSSEISFQGYEQLGGNDQSVLLAISAQLGINGLMIEANPPGPVGQQLRQALDFFNDDGRPLRTKKTSFRSLLIDAGYDDPESGAALKRIKASLNRLSNAQLREINHATGWEWRCNLISTWSNNKTGEVFVAVNPRLTSAVFRGQHVRVSLIERNSLQTEVGKILHCWLSSNIRLGQSLGNGGGAHIDTLAPHVWGPAWEEATAKIRARRRAQLRDALDEIDDRTDWIIDQTSDGLVLVSRPKTLPGAASRREQPPAKVVTTPGQSGNNPRPKW